MHGKNGQPAHRFGQFRILDKKDVHFGIDRPGWRHNVLVRLARIANNRAVLHVVAAVERQALLHSDAGIDFGELEIVLGLDNDFDQLVCQKFRIIDRLLWIKTLGGQCLLMKIFAAHIVEERAGVAVSGGDNNVGDRNAGLPAGPLPRRGVTRSEGPTRSQNTRAICRRPCLKTRALAFKGSWTPVDRRSSK